MTCGHNKQTFVVGEHTLLGGRKKTVKLNIISVKKGWVDQNIASANIFLPNRQTEPSSQNLEAMQVDVDDVEDVNDDDDNKTVDNNESLFIAPVAIPHGVKWFATNGREPINGPVPLKNWFIRTPIGETLGPASHEAAALKSRLEMWLLSFPTNHLPKVIQLTSRKLVSIGKRGTNRKEILNFFGVLILITRFEFTSRASLWSTTAPSKYVPAPRFGNTGMARQRFDNIWHCICFSSQPETRPDGMSSENYR